VSAAIEQVASGSVNAWIIGDEEEVIVIDPGSDADAVLAAVGERDILAVICTHGHASHVEAAVTVANRDQSPVAVHPLDRISWREVHPSDAAEIEMADGGLFDVADVQLEVIHSPGHSPGSVSLYCEDLGVVFSGDTMNSDGPVPHEDTYPDFSGQLTAIGEQLLTLPPATRVLPGHGDELTISAAEKQFNSWASARS
jgi:glyoxylase-like metal-dependent hydrolase (beta-lactamase superfamily II)